MLASSVTSRTCCGTYSASRYRGLRHSTRCSVHGKDRPVLQLHNRQELTLDDVRDAYEVCSLIPAPDERAQCYSVFGIDGVRMSQYYDAVLQLEAGLQIASPFAVSGFDPDDTHWAAQASVSE